MASTTESRKSATKRKEPAEEDETEIEEKKEAVIKKQKSDLTDVVIIDLDQTEVFQKFAIPTTPTTLIATLYGGSVQTHGTNFTVNFSKKDLRCFVFKEYGSKEAARIAAQEWRERTSNELKMTRQIFTSSVPLEKKQYFALFLDGDGTIYVCVSGTPQIEIAQSSDSGVPAIIEEFKKYYPDFTYVKVRPHQGNWRATYHLCYCGIKALPLLIDWAQHGVLKAQQALKVLPLFMTKLRSARARANPEEMKEQQRVRLELQKMKLLESYQAQRFDGYEDRMTPPAAAGLVDAEGCIKMCGNPGTESLQVTIAQKSSPELLHLLNRQVGDDTGNVTSESIRFQSHNAAAFLKKILPYLVQKKEQAVIGIKIQELKTEQPDGYKAEVAKLNAELQRLKHL